jgi:hypothetical protein
VIVFMAPRVAARTFAQVLESWGVLHPLSVGLPPRQPRETRAETIPREIRCDRVLPCSSYSTNTSRRTRACGRRPLAAPDGCRRPCSHSWSVRVDTPSTCANRACERPERVRASLMADTGMRCTRAGISAPGPSADRRALDSRDRQHLTLPTYSSPYGNDAYICRKR